MKILFGMRDDGDMTEPMNIMILSALAKKLGHQVSLWVMERDDLKETLAGTKPDIAAFSCITGSHRYYLSYARRLKKLSPETITAFGGPHFTFFPGEIFRNPDIDFLCVGEGYDAWPDALRALGNNELLDNIPNLVTQNNAREVLEVPSELVQLGEATGLSGVQKSFDQYALSRHHLRPRRDDLDSLPFMDRSLIYDNTEFKHRYKRTMMASHGCPFRCTYCFEHQSQLIYRGLGIVRRWLSVDRFLDELEYVKKNWDTRFFKFYDDIFPPFPSDTEIAWHQEFCQKYPAKIGLPFHILTRCDLVIRLREKGIDVLADWKKAGLASMTMSIESGNRFIRDHILMRDMSARDIVEAFQMAFDKQIPTFPNTILGIPAPILPRPDDQDFEGKLAKIARDLEILRRINGSRANLEEIQRLIRSWLPKERQTRKVIVGVLKSLGLRHSQLEYDGESVAFTLEQKPGFVEFPILFPYPKTKATEWCIARRDFDGDFEKLHASYQTKSPLACYAEKEKDVLQNMALLGTFLALFTTAKSRWGCFLNKYLQRLFIGHLARATHPWAKKLYLWLYTVSKTYMHRTRVYPMRYTWGEEFKFCRQMIRLDFWKQEKKRIGRGVQSN